MSEQARTPAHPRVGKRPPNYGMILEPFPLTRGEVDRMLEACWQARGECCQRRDRAVIVVLWRAGLRIAECLNLRLRDVDVGDEPHVHVHLGKGRKSRHVPIDDGASEIIAEWLQVRPTPQEGEWLFVSQAKHGGGGRLSYTATYDMLRRRARQAGVVQRTNPHQFRHTFAAEVLREGWSLPLLSAALGHDNIASTHAYARHVYAGELRRAAKARAWVTAGRRITN